MSDLRAQKVSAEMKQNGMANVQVIGIGKHAESKEAFFKFLKERKIAVEKQRDELKPQWLQDWQDAQGPGQSAPL